MGLWTIFDNLMTKYFSYHTQMFEPFSSTISLITINQGLDFWTKIKTLSALCWYPYPVYNLFLVSVKNNQNLENRKGLNIHILSFPICIFNDLNISLSWADGFVCFIFFQFELVTLCVITISENKTILKVSGLGKSGNIYKSYLVSRKV